MDFAVANNAKRKTNITVYREVMNNGRLQMGSLIKGVTRLRPRQARPTLGPQAHLKAYVIYTK
jgi:hypothetical protein